MILYYSKAKLEKTLDIVRKMNGAGNDFIIINNMVEHLPETCFPTLARTLCERHLSIGADGLMIVDAPLQGGDYRMLFFNSDGAVHFPEPQVNHLKAWYDIVL